MRWLEVVSIRSAQGIDAVREELMDHLANLERANGMVEIRCYRHSEIENDVTVHLFWESIPCDESSSRPEHGSAIGRQIAYALRDFGLVDHSVWIEQRGDRHE